MKGKLTETQTNDRNVIDNLKTEHDKLEGEAISSSLRSQSQLGDFDSNEKCLAKLEENKLENRSVNLEADIEAKEQLKFYSQILLSIVALIIFVLLVRIRVNAIIHRGLLSFIKKIIAEAKFDEAKIAKLPKTVHNALNRLLYIVDSIIAELPESLQSVLKPLLSMVETMIPASDNATNAEPSFLETYLQSVIKSVLSFAESVNAGTQKAGPTIAEHSAAFVSAVQSLLSNSGIKTALTPVFEKAVALLTSSNLSLQRSSM